MRLFAFLEGNPIPTVLTWEIIAGEEMYTGLRELAEYLLLPIVGIRECAGVEVVGLLEVRDMPQSKVETKIDSSRIFTYASDELRICIRENKTGRTKVIATESLAQLAADRYSRACVKFAEEFNGVLTERLRREIPHFTRNISDFAELAEWVRAKPA